MRKAKQDEVTVEKLLTDPDSSDEIIGFHARQAVEKCLKGMLAEHEIDYPYVRDLQALMQLVRRHKISFPEGLEEARRLTPFAAIMRYEEFPSDDPQLALDREWAINCVRQIRAWAESLLRAKHDG